MRKGTYPTATDMFCGAGGSSLGMHDAGIEVMIAANHWQLAIDTHATNFPAVEHDCADISAVDPRRYGRTDFLWASPECTNHSLAKGKPRRNLSQGELFAAKIDPAEERSRATMWDVVRFAEHHRYELVLVENVVDAAYWELFEAWLAAMRALGYEHRVLSLNSMHFHPTPQSRDRLYIVFWRRGNPAPDLDARPVAWCERCGVDRESRQAWKRNPKTGALHTVGRYRRQYVYACGVCAEVVEPYYFCALSAIDWTIAAKRIGDRPIPLKERTRARIKYGLDKFGREPLIVITNMTTDRGRVRSVADPHFAQTGSALTALVAPWLMTAGSRETAPSSATGAVPTLTGSERFGVAMAPVLVPTDFGHDGEKRGASVLAPMPTQTARQTMGIASPAPFLVTLRGTGADQLPSAPSPLTSTVGTVSAGGIHHALIQGSAMLTLRGRPDLLANPITDPLQTQVASAGQSVVISRQPYLVQYYGTGSASGGGEPVPTVTTLDRNALVEPSPELSVDDCYFRMLNSNEIQAAMAFPAAYKVLGTSRDRVRQCGNAVTPPVPKWIIRQALASLYPEAA